MSSQSSTSPLQATTSVAPVPSVHVDSFALDDNIIRGGTRTPPPNTTLRPFSTPISNKISGDLPYSSVVPDQDKAYRLRLAAETAGHFVGPVPCEYFLNTFLPPQAGAGDAPDLAVRFNQMSLAMSEAGMYEPFIEAAKPLAPDLFFVNTSNNPDMACQGLKPDIGVYDSKYKPGRITDFSAMEFWVEFKHKQEDDGFRDEDPDKSSIRGGKTFFEHIAQCSQLTRGQIAPYAAAQLGTQFRTHIFSLLICGSFARFIRWDRASAIVSRRFNYVEEGHYLTRFLRSYNSLHHRGSDESVSRASEAEVTLGMRHLRSQADRFLKLMVPRDSGATQSGSYLISYPEYVSRSPFGRATRAFLAYDLDNGKTVFLKDYWRIDAPGMEKEGDIYVKLKKHNVRHIASFDCGGNVSDHHTLAPSMPRILTTNKDVKNGLNNIPRYRHYRMVLSTVFRDLLSFRSSWEYVNAVADAMEAHHDAFSKAHILHRDVSVGNIMLGENGEGILIDWDQSVGVNDTELTVRRPGRTGTWQFVSGKLLSDRKHVHGLEDDRESFLWVLLWLSLRFTDNSESPASLGTTLQLFDETFATGDGISGGRLKDHALVSQTGAPHKVKFTDRPCLDDLFRRLALIFAVRYENEPEKDMDEGSELKSFLQKHRSLRTQQLADSYSLVNTIRSSLLDRNRWPVTDIAVVQVVGIPDGSRKHMQDQEEMELLVPRLHKVPRTK